MAGARGQESIAVDEQQRALRKRMEERPWPYGFFQAVRILQLLEEDREPVGRFTKPGQEAVRFGAHTGIGFPASEVQSIERDEDGTPRMCVNIMGAIGPMGVLPLAYTALVRERGRARDYTPRDFLDIFHNRLLSLFYRAWERCRFGVAFERGERDRLSHHLADLIGMGTAGMEERQEVPDAALLFYAGLLGMNTRPAIALEQILADYFAVPVEVEQFAGAWHRIEDRDTCRLGEDDGVSQRLGGGALAGNRIWDEQSRVRIRLGPLAMEQYENFLPGGAAHAQLRAIAAFCAGMQFDIETELILRREDVPGCELIAETGAGWRLGWTTWVKSAVFTRDPADTVLQLEQAA